MKWDKIFWTLLCLMGKDGGRGTNSHHSHTKRQNDKMNNECEMAMAKIEMYNLPVSFVQIYCKLPGVFSSPIRLC